MGNLTTSNSAIQDNFKQAKLLVIEDDIDHGAIIQDLIRHCLPEVKSTLVRSEAEALTFLDRCITEEWEFPKMILLDLYLPERQNGWRLLERIKGLPTAMSKIPVVLFSNSTNKRDIAEAYQRGCSSYLVKPSQTADWMTYMQILRTYWWETVTLPKVGFTLF